MVEASGSHLGTPSASQGGQENRRRPSTSTASKRNSYYDQQRVGEKSRPVSWSSQATSKSKGKRASYQVPPDVANLDEAAVPHPVGPSRTDSLERRRAIEQGQKPTRQHQSFSRPTSNRRPTQDKPENDDLTEIDAPPPVRTTSQPAAELPSQQSPEGSRDDADDADTESSGAQPPWVQRHPEEYLPKERPPPKIPRALTELYTISYLIFFSIFGTLARLGMQWLTFYPGAPIVTPVIWANFAGSLIMGFLAEDQGLLRDSWATSATEKRSSARSRPSDLERLSKAERAKVKKTIPLYIGLATGFCGSLTSFSSFARDFFLALSNDLPTPIDHPNTLAAATPPSTTSTVNRNGGYSFESWTAVVITTLALSLGALIVGAHLALFAESLTPRIPKKFTRVFLDPFMVFLAAGCWLGAVFMAIWPPDRPGGPASNGPAASNETWRGQAIFAIVFAPVGCLLRYYASLKLNGLVAAFPLGTFAVNMLGTAVEGMCYDLQHVGIGIMGRIGGGRYLGGGN
ncbi:hypothetical protein KC332_g14578 [Hortaea werneckii]|uniref:Uncharacterized protein n=1 Tax=Hortaea werneckii EXF-2000 TaxID=1157616 RepID=A0A1Z5T4X8_HORWE|nr:hypothetical protein KC358_g14364 [Hortaea werneckii]OTA31074.1 hypothetical protein BTJ68_09968 [Hortaea werneckii EXF-2000]KAI6806480.1 hypothetical protein KC350_g14139 [Hortaea werneckii]KAI6907187.1 hypothetical protein KC348_g14337 [Hortaea werneckii]KAI6924405.1 hypothetical protein KC341_g14084 [Hortaea werneckii]